MEIKGLNMREVFEHMTAVRRKLKGKNAGRRFLDEAFADVPAIETVFDWICETTASKEGLTRKDKRLLLRMERDFFLLLALWHREKYPNADKTALKVLGGETGQSGRRN